MDLLITKHYFFTNVKELSSVLSAILQDLTNTVELRYLPTEKNENESVWDMFDDNVFCIKKPKKKKKVRSSSASSVLSADLKWRELAKA